MLTSPDSFLLAIVTNHTREHIGSIKLGPINPHHKAAPIGLAIGVKTGVGVVTAMVTAAIIWAFDSLKLAKVLAGACAGKMGSDNANA
jgi:ribosomal-protein-alanine N-acetyltransferase